MNPIQVVKRWVVGLWQRFVGLEPGRRHVPEPDHLPRPKPERSPLPEPDHLPRPKPERSPLPSAPKTPRVREKRLIVYSKEHGGRLGLSIVSWIIPRESQPKQVEKTVDGSWPPDLRPLPDDFTCHIVWRDESLGLLANHQNSIWVDAMTAAAIVSLDKRKRANGLRESIRVIIAHPGFVEGSRFLLELRDDWPSGVEAIDHSERPVALESFALELRSLAESLGPEGEMVIVEAPDLSVSDVEEIRRFASVARVERLTPDRLRHDFAQTYCTRLRTGRSTISVRTNSLCLPVATWGTILSVRFAIDSDGPGARRVFRLARDWSARTLDFRFEEQASRELTLSTRRFSVTLPDRASNGETASASLEFLASETTGAILARLWSETHDPPICPVCGGVKQRLVAETGLIKCLVCGQEHTSLEPRVVHKCLDVLRPCTGPTPAEDPRPARQPCPVAVCVGLSGKKLGTNYFNRAARLVDSLSAAGRLDHIAIDWTGIGPAGRSFGTWSAEILAAGGFKALAEQAILGRVSIEPTAGLDESLRLALAPECWAGNISGGVLAVVVSGDGHDLGPSSIFRDPARRWAWVISVRRAVGVPLHWGAFLESGAERDEVRQALTHLVLLGRQSRSAENLVHDWPSAGDHSEDSDPSAALVIAAAAEASSIGPSRTNRVGIVAG
jgi:hypothetical protein